MDYKVIYRAYRPQTFDDVIGQDPIVKTLQNSIKNNHISHAYLFCGPRGTGKTSIARLFAKAINCEKNDGKQCNKCYSCTSITEGDNPDVVEIDAASNSGVDSVRDIIDQVQYPPLSSRYKIYIIDEVHSMSSTAFNALLKTLEEPPSYCIFILCTTEPHKVLPTILSRVQRYDFSRVSDENLIKNMEKILKKEKVSYDEDSLKVIASLADGGVRDSLSLLDQAITYCSRKININDINNLFGILTVGETLKYIKLISEKNLKSLLELFNTHYSKGVDILKLHDNLINLLKEMLIYKLSKDPHLLSFAKSNDLDTINIDTHTANNMLQKLIDIRATYRTSDSINSTFELGLISLVVGETKQVQYIPVQEEQNLIYKSNTTSPSYVDKNKIEESKNYNFNKSKDTQPKLEKPVYVDEIAPSTSSANELTRDSYNNENIQAKDTPNKIEKNDSKQNSLSEDDINILTILHNNNKLATKELAKEFLNNLSKATKEDMTLKLIGYLNSCVFKAHALNHSILVCSRAAVTKHLQEYDQQKIIDGINKLTNTNNQSIIIVEKSRFESLTKEYILLREEKKLEILEKRKEEILQNKPSQEDMMSAEDFLNDIQG